MVSCNICEKDFDFSAMRHVISKKGIIKVCKDCFNEDMLPISKPDLDKVDESLNQNISYAKLSENAGFRRMEMDKKRISDFGKNSGVLRGESMRRISDKSIEESVRKLPPNEDLVENFHWIVMRARRFKKISQKKLAEEIQEPESVIALAERGIISEGKENFVKKLEQFLGIMISKKTLENRKNVDSNRVMKMKVIDKFLEDDDLEGLDDYSRKSGKRKWWQFGRRKNDFEEIDSEEENEIEEEIPKNPFFKVPD